MKKLNKEEIEFVSQCLKEGKPLPDSYRYIIPFETKKEYELTYGGKEREEDILADTMAVPLQPVKTFGNGNGGWTNKLIFGDNLQVLKALMDDPYVYDKNTGRGKVKLIYIDPPFATRQEFRGSQDQKAYQDKIVGAQFLEFLRKRLVFLRELLADDGSIYVHLDQRKMHYIKQIMDEVFGEQNFQNCISWRREVARGMKKYAQFFGKNVEYLLLYTKRGNDGVWNRIEGQTIISEAGAEQNFSKDAEGYFSTSHRGTYSDESIVELAKQNRIFVTRQGKLIEKNGKVATTNGTIRIKYYLEKVKNGYLKRFSLDNLWADIRGIAECSPEERLNFPTQKPERLLERIISASSNTGDLILDAFAGSGTTGAVAEKLGRRWIMIDCSKLAVYTMQKRLLNLREGIGSRGKRLEPQPFTLYNAGLYDYKMIKALPWDKYREFVLKLFQCRDEPHRIAGVQLDGYLARDPVMVFNYKKHKDVILDRGFIDDLHKILGDKVGYKFFIIAPAASVMFFEDYIEKGKTKYFALRIPYSIIDELHRRGFTHIKQPVSEFDVNDTVDAVGFDFIQIPDVECDYFIEKSRGQMELNKSNKEAVIEIRKFKSNILSKKPLKFGNRETLSMVMVDYDYNTEVFDFDDVFYAEDIKKQSWEVRFDADKIDGQIMIIYIDIFGNEKREVKKLREFRNKE